MINSAKVMALAARRCSSEPHDARAAHACCCCGRWAPRRRTDHDRHAARAADSGSHSEPARHLRDSVGNVFEGWCSLPRMFGPAKLASSGKSRTTTTYVFHLAPACAFRRKRFDAAVAKFSWIGPGRVRESTEIALGEDSSRHMVDPYTVRIRSISAPAVCCSPSLAAFVMVSPRWLRPTRCNDRTGPFRFSEWPRRLGHLGAQYGLLGPPAV